MAADSEFEVLGFETVMKQVGAKLSGLAEGNNGSAVSMLADVAEAEIQKALAMLHAHIPGPG